MKASWEEQALGELCEFRNGLWKGKKEPLTKAFVIRNTNFTKSGVLNDSDIAELDVETKQLAKRQLELGDIILEKSGGGPKQPVGRVISFEIAEGTYSFSNFTSVVRVQDKTLVDPTFLHRFLHFVYLSGRTIEMQKRSTGIRNLDFDAYKAIPIPLPPLEEQERIVAVLDEAFAALDRARTHAETNLKNARELFESYKQHRFFPELRQHPETTLGDSCSFRNGKAHEKAIDPDGEFVVVNSKFVSTDGKSQKKTGDIISPLFAGEIVLVMSDVPNGKTLGKCFLIDEDDRYSLNQRICAISSDDYEAEFLFFQLNRHSHFLSFNNGENQTNLRKAEILRCPLHLPDRDTQKRIAGELKEMSGYVQDVEALAQMKLEAIDNLRQSLLEKAFAGELT